MPHYCVHNVTLHTFWHDWLVEMYTNDVLSRRGIEVNDILIYKNSIQTVHTEHKKTCTNIKNGWSFSFSALMLLVVQQEGTASLLLKRILLQHYPDVIF